MKGKCLAKIAAAPVENVKIVGILANKKNIENQLKYTSNNLQDFANMKTEDLKYILPLTDTALKTDDIISLAGNKKVNFEKLDMRIGIHTGPVIAGIIGSTVVRYDIFGSDVLIANKMESSGLPGKINISEDTKNLLESKEMPYNLTLNKVVEIPSVGREVKCFFIENEQDN